MSDTNDVEDIDAIRERKAEELKRQLDASAEDATAEGAQTKDAPKEPIHVEDAGHFGSLVADHSPVLVDFYADWCGPCKMLEPVVESVAANTAGTVAKVDIDAHQDLARKYEVRGVPTLYLFVDGEPVERLVGVQDERTLTELVQANA